MKPGQEMKLMHESTTPGQTEPKIGVMICGHGSRSKSAVTEFTILAKKLAPFFLDWPISNGYLEFATPVIKIGLDKLREQGVTQVLGFEAEFGLAQESHHHHVEGQGVSEPGSNIEDCEPCVSLCSRGCRLDIDHHHSQSHDHSNDHRHNLYPHAKHLHGPKSVRNRQPTSATKAE